MAELTHRPDDRPEHRTEHRTEHGPDHGRERELRARIAELEALLEARTQTIIGMGARLAELQGDAPPSVTARLREAEAELAQLRATKVLRYSEVPRRIYARARRWARG